MFSNPMYLLLIVPMLLAWWSQGKVRQTYKKYDAQPNQRGYRGMDIARRLIAHYGLAGITIEKAEGYLTDHYDSRSNILRLSDGVANGSSITSLGIVAHEFGHALQDAENYHFMRLRTMLAPRVGKITQWSSVAFIGGWILGIPVLMAFSALIMAGMVVFSLVTLPVERNASERALASLEMTGLAVGEEREGVRQVLRAAAYTYLAGFTQRIGRFLFYVLLVATAKGFTIPL
jgi:uncharacterized protein